MNKIEKLLTTNPMSRPGKKIEKIENIVIHWVGNAGSTAIANRNYFENLKNQSTRYASSHYIIGLDGEIIQCIPEDEVAYHSGNLSMNYHSIGIENCHPDWTGEFNENTYNALIELLADLCTRYNLSGEKIIRHYDVSRKICPKYYVENENEFDRLKENVKIRLSNQVHNTEKREEFEMAKIYRNGSTRETVYADTALTKVIGSLDKWEQCECLAVVNNRYLVKYKVNGTENYKAGFVKYNGGL